MGATWGLSVWCFVPLFELKNKHICCFTIGGQSKKYRTSDTFHSHRRESFRLVANVMSCVLNSVTGHNFLQQEFSNLTPPNS